MADGVVEVLVASEVHEVVHRAGSLGWVEHRGVLAEVGGDGGGVGLGGIDAELERIVELLGLLGGSVDGCALGGAVGEGGRSDGGVARVGRHGGVAAIGRSDGGGVGRRALVVVVREVRDAEENGHDHDDGSHHTDDGARGFLATCGLGLHLAAELTVGLLAFAFGGSHEGERLAVERLRRPSTGSLHYSWR